MRRTPPLPLAHGPALRHDAAGSPYLDYRAREPLPEEPLPGPEPDEEPTEPIRRLGRVPERRELPPIFERRYDLESPEPEAEPESRGIWRLFDWLAGSPRSAESTG